MERKILDINKVFFGLIVLVFTLAACNETNNLGMDLLPSTDLIDVKSTIIKDEISSFTHKEDSVKTDEGSKSLLGSFQDPVFGNTTVNFATQFRLQRFPNFGTNPVADSLRLFLYYRSVYGDTVTRQKFKVYELESGIDADAEYFQDTDLKSFSSDQIIGEVDYLPAIKLDSVNADTFFQLITIPLDLSLADKLVNADSLEMNNNDVFLEFFKGLYIETEKITDDGGAILSLDAASSSSFQGSALLLFYNNDENKAEAEPDTLSMPYIISNFSARINQITHDYTATAFEPNLNSETVEDSLIYVQPLGGLKSRILIDDLSSWKDSTNTAINKAELIFQVDTIASDIYNLRPPRKLLFTFVDENGSEFYPIDYFFSPTFYGGFLYEDYTYRFNITQHVQQIIDGNAENNGFFLTTGRKNSEANRVVLKGSTSTAGIKLVISYSKYLQQ